MAHDQFQRVGSLGDHFMTNRSLRTRKSGRRVTRTDMLRAKRLNYLAEQARNYSRRPIAFKVLRETLEADDTWRARQGWFERCLPPRAPDTRPPRSLLVEVDRV